MKALSLGRNSSVMVSAPGASQSMSASAHCRSLIFASIASMSIAIDDLLQSVDASWCSPTARVYTVGVKRLMPQPIRASGCGMQ